MYGLYSEEALKQLTLESHRMLYQCQQKDRTVCNVFLDAMFSIKFRYPLFAEKADKYIKEMKEYYEIIEWKEGCRNDASRWYEIVDCTIRQSYGELFKFILERF